jgi:hypothetical protein
MASRLRFPLLILVASAFLYLSLFNLDGIPRLVPQDQFIFLDDARRMTTGQRLYIDIFQYTLPGTELLYFGLIKLFGATMYLPNVTVLILGLASTIIAFMLSSAVLSGWETVLPPLFYLCLGWHHTLDATHHKFSVLLVYAATAAILWRPSVANLILAGTLCGLATCFTQTRGLVLFAFAAFLAYENKYRAGTINSLIRKELCLICPFLLVLGTLCMFLVSELGIHSLLAEMVDFPLFYYRFDNVHNTWASIWLFDFSADNPVVILYSAIIHSIVPGAYIVLLIYEQRAALKQSYEQWRRLMLLAVVGIALFTSVAYAPIWVRLCEISLPAFILMVWLSNETARSTVLKSVQWASVAVSLIALPLYSQTRWQGLLQAPAGKVFEYDHGEYDRLNWMTAHTVPGEYVFWASSQAPAPYYLLELKNPIKLPFLTNNGYTLPSQVSEARRDLERSRPQLVYWAAELDNDQADGQSCDHLDPLRVYVRDHYEPLKTFTNGDRVWRLTRTLSSPPMLVKSASR